MIFPTIWTILVVSALLYFLRGRGRTPAVMGIALSGIVLLGDVVTVVSNPTHRNVTEFTLGASLDTLFLAFLVWLAFVKAPHRPRSHRR